MGIGRGVCFQCMRACCTIYHCENIECSCRTVQLYLEGSQAELETEPQVNAEVVRQKIEEHVVSAKQRDEEEGGLSQASVSHKQGKKKQRCRR